MSQVDLWIHPNFDAFYCSYYFDGLFKLIDPNRIRFTTDTFPLFSQKYSCAIINPRNNRKIFIDSGDSLKIDMKALEWCNLYGKVNPDFSMVPHRYRKKIKAIGPGFGVKVFRLSTIQKILGQHLLRFYFDIPNFEEHFANFFRQYRYRLPESMYQPSISNDNYVFSIATYWQEAQETNRQRLNYMQVCRQVPKIIDETGFISRRNEHLPELSGFLFDKVLSLDEYLSKTKRSVFVFNTPAVEGCLGWKLGEYLALGKAIISTPIGKPLPQPLIDGKHIHYVDGSRDSISEAVNRLLNDCEYRHYLEYNARQYYLDYLQPKRVMERLLYF